MKPSEESLQIAAQCWCDDETSHIEMIPDLATAFAKRLDKQKEGYTLVPNEPSEEMIDAFFDSMDKRGFRPTASDVGIDDASAFYKAMLEAAE